MDGKSKALFVVISFLVILSVASLFYKTVILQDFEVTETETEVSE